MLDTFFLMSEKADLDLVKRGIFGECHIRCLEHSDESMTWGSRIYKNLTDVRRFRPLHKHADITVLRNPNIAQSVIVSERGWYMYVRDNELANRSEIDEGWLIATESEFNDELTEEHQKIFTAAILKVLRALAGNGKPAPLSELISVLGLTEFVSHPATLRDGTFTFDRQGGSDGAFDIISIQMSYYYFIPREIIGVIGATAGIF